MSALVMATLLTSAGALATTQETGPPVPYPVRVAPPAPPPPPRIFPPERLMVNLNGYFTADDYPAAALNDEQEGTSHFRLMIGTDGRVSRCEITASSGFAALDAATCRILTARARYRPARDASGALLAGADSGRVTWRLPLTVAEGRAGVPQPDQSAFRLYNFRTLISPGDYPDAAFQARASGISVVRLAIGTRGQVIGCAVAEGSGSDALDGAACRILAARARYGAARNAEGQPACDVDEVRIAWRLPASRPAWVRPGPPERVPPALSTQLNANLCPGWAAPSPEEDVPGAYAS